MPNPMSSAGTVMYREVVNSMYSRSLTPNAGRLPSPRNGPSKTARPSSTLPATTTATL